MKAHHCYEWNHETSCTNATAVIVIVVIIFVVVVVIIIIIVVVVVSNLTQANVKR